MDLLVAAADSTLAQSVAVPSNIVSDTVSFTAVASSSKSTIKPKVKVERYVLPSHPCLFLFSDLETMMHNQLIISLTYSSFT